MWIFLGCQNQSEMYKYCFFQNDDKVDHKTYWLVQTHCWTNLLCKRCFGKSMIHANLF